jgi:hypothetical protein
MNRSTQNRNRVKTNILADLEIDITGCPLVVLPCGFSKKCRIQFYHDSLVHEISDNNKKVIVTYSRLKEQTLCEIYNEVTEGKFYSVSTTKRGNKFLIKSTESFKY